MAVTKKLTTLSKTLKIEKRTQKPLINLELADAISEREIEGEISPSISSFDIKSENMNPNEDPGRELKQFHAMEVGQLRHQTGNPEKLLPPNLYPSAYQRPPMQHAPPGYYPPQQQQYYPPQYPPQQQEYRDPNHIELPTPQLKFIQIPEELKKKYPDRFQEIIKKEVELGEFHAPVKKQQTIPESSGGEGITIEQGILFILEEVAKLRQENKELRTICNRIDKRLCLKYPIERKKKDDDK